MHSWSSEIDIPNANLAFSTTDQKSGFGGVTWGKEETKAEAVRQAWRSWCFCPERKRSATAQVLINMNLNADVFKNNDEHDLLEQNHLSILEEHI